MIKEKTISASEEVGYIKCKINKPKNNKSEDIHQKVPNPEIVIDFTKDDD